jgi:hypothetical protein
VPGSAGASVAIVSSGSASSEELLERAKKARTLRPINIKIRTRGEVFFFAGVGVEGGVETVAGVEAAVAMLLDGAVVPRVGTAGITMRSVGFFAFEEDVFLAALEALRLVAGLRVGVFFDALLLFAELLLFDALLLFAELFAATFFAGRLAGAFFFAATFDSSDLN